MLQDDRFARCLAGELCEQTLSQVSWGVECLLALPTTWGSHGHTGVHSKLKQTKLCPRMGEHGGKGPAPGNGEVWDKVVP